MAFLGSGSNSVNNPGSTTIACTMSPNVTAGSLLVAGISWGSHTINISGVSGGGTWTLIGSPIRDTVNEQSFQLAYCQNATGGATTVTATFSASVSYRRIAVVEHSGIATTGALDQNAGQFGTNTTATDNVTSGPITPTVNGCLIVGGVMDSNTAGNPTHTAGTGFTKRVNLDGVGMEDRVQATAAQVSGTWTFANVARYEAAVASFKPASSGQNLTHTATDAAGLVDAVTVSLRHARAQADSEALSDAATARQTHARVATDALGLSDTVVIAMVADVGDTEGLADSVTMVQSHVSRPTDSAGMSDTVLPRLGIGLLPQDQLGLSDNSATTVGLGASVTDTEGLSDTVVVANFKNIPIDIGDNAGLADTSSTAMSLVRTVSDILGGSDAVTASQGHGRSTVDAVAATDNVVVSHGLGSSHSDSAGLSDTTSASWVLAIAIADALGITDVADAVLRATISQVDVDSMGLSDNALLQLYLLLTQNLVDSMGITDSASVSVALRAAPVDVLGLSDSSLLASAQALPALSPLDVWDLLSIAMDMPTGYGDALGLSDDASVVMFAGVVPAGDPTARFGPMRRGGSARLVDRTGTDRIVASNRTGELT